MTAIEERLGPLARLPGDVLSLVAADGGLIWISPSVERTMGYTPEQIHEFGVMDLVHPDDGASIAAVWQDVLTEVGGERRLELRVRHADGSWRWIDLIITNLIDDTAVGAVVANFRDITERQEAIEALRVSEERFRTLLHNSADGIVVLSADRSISWVSGAVEQMFGRTPEELFASSRLDFVHPADQDRATKALTGVMGEPGKQGVLEARVLHANGTWRWTEVDSINLLHDPVVNGVVIHIRDVTERKEAQHALRESEELFRSLAQSSPTGIYRRDIRGRVMYVNETWQEITGYRLEEALELDPTQVVHPDDQALLPAPSAPDSERADEKPIEFRMLRKDGQVRWVSLRTAPIYDDDGELEGRLGAIEDITERMDAQRDSQRLTDIFNATHDLVAIADTTGTLLYLNRAGRRFFALPEQGGGGELVGFDLFDKLSPDMHGTSEQEISAALERGGVWSGELAVIRHDGTVVPHLCQLLGHAGDTGEIEFYSGILHDISERKAFEYRLAHQATHDPLTGLPNRTLLLDRLEMAMSRARRHMRRLAVLFLDLDHFKVVNDSLGHGLGDRLLVAVAERLKVALRPDDTIARFGGDEFVVLCENLVSQDDAIAIAERVNDAISGPFVVDDAEVFVGVSIGIAFPEDRDANPESLIRDADAAMYQAKDRGRARWVIFDHAMRAGAVDRLDIENALRRALERHELRVHYQPIISLGTGSVIGVEALLRWEHPERGLLLPGDFIALAEETGLIIPIGTWVLGQACRQVNRWQAAHPNLPRLVLAVNLSSRQLGYPDLVDDVAAVLDEAAIDPACIELEITESVLMDDVETSHEMLSKLKALGVRLVVDDFGTGYSSLSYLRQFPVDQLKVDRSFVAGLGQDQGDSAIVTAIVTLAHTLGLDAVAEGVETAEQLAELRVLGCDKAQGYHMARPAAGPDIESLLGHDRTW